MYLNLPITLPFSPPPAFNWDFRLVRYDPSRVVPCSLWGVHFFIDDFRFQSIFRNPDKFLPRLRNFRLVVSPDFSVFVDASHAENIYAVYRNRFVTRYFQQNGLLVVPSVTWGDIESLEYVLQGLPERSVIAVRCGARDAQDMNFVEGYKLVIGCLQPTHVLVYGSLPYELRDLACIIEKPISYMSSKISKVEILK